MNKKKLITIIFAIITAIVSSKYCSSDKNDVSTEVIKETNRSDSKNRSRFDETVNSANRQEIDALTEASRVINYVKSNRRLPNCYLTKKAAKKQGWNPRRGNLCDVLPGKAIGGDYFGNRERKLPSNNKYFEADVNYHCGSRQAARIVFTKKGDVWLTLDHYKTFTKK